MTDFSTTFLGKEWTEVKTFFSTETHDLLDILKPLVAALEADAEKVGVATVKAAAVAAVAAASAAKASGSTSSEAGQAALAAAETAAVAGLVTLGKDALADGETALSASTTHTLATAAVAS